MLRPIGAGLLALVGILGLVLVSSALAVVGLDERAGTEPMTVDKASQAIMLDQQLIPFSNTTAEVRVESETPVFIGTANGVDARSYLSGTAHEEVTAINLPGRIEHRFVDGGAELETQPDTRDWWMSMEHGTNVSATLPLDNEPRVVVITAEEGSIKGTQVTVKIDAPGVVPFSLLGIALSVVAFAAAAWLFLTWRNDQPRVATKKRSGTAGAGPDGGPRRREVGAYK